MKILGTVIEIKSDKEIWLIDYPSGFQKLNLPVNVSIGFSKNMASSYTVINSKLNKNRLVIELERDSRIGNSRIQIEMGVWIEPEAIILDSDTGYFISDLVGCSVFDAKTGDLIGNVIDVYNLPANDVWIVKTQDGELPFPAVEHFIDKVDLETKSIKIHVIEGLMDLIQ